MPRIRFVAVAAAALLTSLLSQPAGAGTKDVPLKKGADFAKTRTALLKAGWQPVVSELMRGDDTPENQFGGAGEMYEAGFIEVQQCTQGHVACIFNYKRGKQCLQLITVGEVGIFKGKQYPVLVHWTNECFQN